MIVRSFSAMGHFKASLFATDIESDTAVIEVCKRQELRNFVF